MGSVTVQNGSHDTIFEISLSQRTTGVVVVVAWLEAGMLVDEGRVGERQRSS